MPKYLISSDSPITARELNRPDLPDWRPETGLPGTPEHPWVPGGRPTLPPREEWPPLPPMPELPERPGHGLPPQWPFPPSIGLPIPPSPEFPMVPLPPEVDPPGIWPPVRPELPDLSGKTLALAYVFVSRHVSKLCWVVIDHEEVKEKLQAIKDKLPAGGVGGTPPQRPTPGTPGAQPR